jgi:hypothetical protein
VSDEIRQTPIGPGLRLLQWVSVFVAYPWFLVQRRRGVFRPLERSLFDEYQHRLSPELGAVMASQLAEINSVQRITARGSECNLYRLVPFRVDLRRTRVFDFPEVEVLLATMRIETSAGGKLSSRIYVVNGRLFSLEFTQDVRPHLGSTVGRVIEFRQRAGLQVGGVEERGGD